MPTHREIILELPLGPPRTFSDGVTIVKQEHEDEAIAVKKHAMENGLNYANNTLIAITAHRRGELAPAPCDRCKDNAKSRKFKECVIVKGTMGGKCTSCYIGRSARYQCLWDEKPRDAPMLNVQAKLDDRASSPETAIPEAKNSSRIEIWLGQLEKRFNKLLEAAQLRFVEAHSDLSKPAYWEWIFNVSNPHSPEAWPSMYVPVKQRIPQIDDWDASRILTLLRLSDDSMLWVRGLTDLDYEASQSQLRAFKTIDGETLPRDITMRDILIQSIELKLGRPIQPREHKAIDPCVSDTKAPNFYEWQFSWKYPIFPDVRGGISRWSPAEVRDCKDALDAGDLIVGIIEGSSSAKDETLTPGLLVAPPVSQNQPLPAKTTQDRMCGPESTEKKATTMPHQDSVESMVSGITNYLSNSTDRSGGFAEIQSMIFQSLLQRAVDEESKSLTEVHLLKVAELQGQLEHVRRQSSEWKKRNDADETNILELQKRIGKLEAESSEKARNLDKMIAKAREDGEIAGKNKAIEDMEASLDDERRAIRRSHLERLEKVREQSYQQGLEAGKSNTGPTSDIGQALAPKLEPLDVQDGIACFQATNVPVQPGREKAPRPLAFEDLSLHGDDLTNPTRNRALRAIFRHWHDLPNKALPTSMFPGGTCLSNFTLTNIASLSKILPIQKAIDELKTEIDRRNQKLPRKAQNLAVTAADFKVVLSHHGVEVDDPRAEARKNDRLVQNDRTNSSTMLTVNQPATDPRNFEGLRSPSDSPHLGQWKRPHTTEEEPRDWNKRQKSSYEPDLYPPREFLPSRRG